MAGLQEQHARRGAQGRDQLPAATGAHLAREQRRERDDRAHGERRGNPQEREGVGGQRLHRGRHQRREQPLVGIPEGQMLSGLDEVELVAVVAVAAGQSNEPRGERQGDKPPRFSLEWLGHMEQKTWRPRSS